jgi:SET domain-containing protein
MLLVKTYLDRSDIHGIGLFAGQRIAKGTVVWRWSPTIDVLLTPEQVAALPPFSREQIEKYTYVDRVLGKLVLCGDDARFFNHADEPNCHDYPDEQGGTTVAARDIEIGEELTSDYASFDASHAAPQIPVPGTPGRA